MMMRSFRDARRIRPQREVVITGARVALFFAAQGALVGGAFVGGYFLRDKAPSTSVATASAKDPLGGLDAQLDAETGRVDYVFNYHNVLTAPGAQAALSTAAASPIVAAKVATRAPRSSSHSKASGGEAGPASKAAVEKPRAAIPARALAARTVRAPDTVESDESDVRALEASVRRLAAKSARNRASAGKLPARAGSTDDELYEAIGEVRR